MTEDKYNTKDIRHIDEKSQEYIAKGNRMTEEIIIDEQDKEKKHRNNEIDCLHFSCRKGESGKVLFWCDFYDDHCDNYTGCYYRKYLRLEQENRELKAYKDINEDFKKVLKLAKENADSNEYCLQELEKENKELKKQIESQKGLITVGSKQQYDMTMAYDKCKTALEEIREIAENAKEGRYTTKSEDYTEGMHIIGCYVLDKINEVLGND